MKTCEDLLVLLYNLDEFSILVGEFLILVLSIVAGGCGGVLLGYILTISRFVSTTYYTCDTFFYFLHQAQQ